MTERLVEFNFLRLKYKNINFHVSYAQSLRVGKEKGKKKKQEKKKKKKK